MRKKKEKRKNRTPEELAEDFWVGLYEAYMQRVKKSIEGERSSSETERFRRYLTALNRINPDELERGKKCFIDFNFLVKPYVPWGKINDILKVLKVEANAIERIIFALKPFPIEQALIADENSALQLFDKAADKVVVDCNKKIKRLSPLVKTLKNLTIEDEGYAQYAPLFLTIGAIEYEIECYRALIKKRETMDKDWLAKYLIDKDIKKSPQKHKYWNVTVSNALKILNPFCHSNNCGNNCKITHQKAITAV